MTKPNTRKQSNGPRKTRPDAILKSLPEKRQDEIAEFGRIHSVYKTMQWLNQAGIKIGSSAVGVFLAQYRVREQLLRNAAAAQAAQYAILKQDPSLTPEHVRRYGQSFFSGLAIEQKDPQVWQMTQQLELQNDKLQLERQKHRDAVKELRAKSLPKPKRQKAGGGISSKTLDQIERELKLM